MLHPPDYQPPSGPGRRNRLGPLPLWAWIVIGLVVIAIIAWIGGVFEVRVSYDPSVVPRGLGTPAPTSK